MVLDLCFDTGGTMMRQSPEKKTRGKGPAAIFMASRLWQSWHEPEKCQEAVCTAWACTG